MLEKFKYINHLGEVLEFGTGSLFANENELHNYEWEVLTIGDKISSFKRGIVSKSIPVLIKCDTAEKGVEMRNRIFEIAEKDVLANKPGKIVINDAYLKCFVVGSSKSEYLIHKQYMRIDLNIQTDSPGWIQEEKYSFRLQELEKDSAFLNYPHGFLFDYGNSLSIREIRNAVFNESDFEMIIYGAVVNPIINIGGNVYAVNVEIASNEYLTIDSMNKTIFLTKNTGEKVNCFNLRSRENYVFAKIPAGNHVISSSNSRLNFDIILKHERSEPKWI